jgi:uncharacterized protein
MLITVVGHILAVGIGISLGLIGGGGSILAVPILVYVMGVSAKVAIAMSLFIVGIVSLVGIIPHWMQGNVNFKVASVFTPIAMLGAYLGARLTALPIITDTLQLICFGVVMVGASFLMIRKSGPKNASSYAVEPDNRETNTAHRYKWLAIPAEGLGVGLLTGFVGVGGGFLIIPTLVLFGNIPMKEAIGTSLLIIAANSAAGFLGYVGQVEVDWVLITSFTVFAIIGTLIGSSLTQFISAKHLQKGFGYFVLVIGVFVLIQR